MMTSESLAQAITRAGGAVELLRNQNWPAFTFPVAPEFTNWRDEQRAWNTTVALMDQSHHMTQLFLGGNRPDSAARVDLAQHVRDVPAGHREAADLGQPGRLPDR